MNDVLELFGKDISSTPKKKWQAIVSKQTCPFVGKRCFKVRKSQPEISIGSCLVNYGRANRPIMICPNRLLENQQIFVDSLHLLTLHEPGNELHVVPEMSIPGGSVDYFLVSARKRKPVDFVGIELQTLDTTGTVWPARERFLRSVGMDADIKAIESPKSFGMNWKMTAKTILIQLHHKVETFENLSKHLVLVVQDCLLEYMRKEFSFAHLSAPRVGDVMHFHAYATERSRRRYSLELIERCSTDSPGIAKALGLQAETNVKMDSILTDIERKLSKSTLLRIA